MFRRYCSHLFSVCQSELICSYKSEQFLLYTDVASCYSSNYLKLRHRTSNFRSSNLHHFNRIPLPRSRKIPLRRTSEKTKVETRPTRTNETQKLRRRTTLCRLRFAIYEVRRHGYRATVTIVNSPGVRIAIVVVPARVLRPNEHRWNWKERPRTIVQKCEQDREDRYLEPERKPKRNEREDSACSYGVAHATQLTKREKGLVNQTRGYIRSVTAGADN